MLSREEINEAEAQINAELEELAKIEKEAEEAAAKLSELRAIKQEQSNVIMRKQRDIRQAVRELKAAEEEAARRLEIEAQNIANQAKLQNETERLSEIVERSEWKQRAKQHQIDGAMFLAVAGRAICADDMGMGKTLQSLMWLDLVEAKAGLVFCLGEVMMNFVQEAEKYTDRTIVIVGRVPKAEAMAALHFANKMRKHPILVVINYEAWNKNRAILKALSDFRFDAVIADEAHTIKEVSGVPFKGVSEVVLAENSCPRCHEATVIRQHLMSCTDFMCGWTADEWHPAEDYRSVRYFLPMTGTPVLNRPDEIYAMLHLIDTKMFPTQSRFIQMFCTYNVQGKLVWQTGGQDMLADTIRGIYLRRTAEQVGIDLPEQEIQIHAIEFDEEAYPMQASIMRQIRVQNQILIDENRSMKMVHVLALLTRERQAAIWPGGISMFMPVLDEDGMPQYRLDDDGIMVAVEEKVHVGSEYNESIKLDKAQELIERAVADGHRVAVFSQFKTALEELDRRLGAGFVRAVRFDGSTPAGDRDSIKSNFNREFAEPPRWDAILCNYKTGGVGLNLTSCTQLIILDEEWNPGKNDQAYKRLRRIGQTEKSQVHVLRVTNAPSPIDQWLSELIEQKGKLVDGFDDAMGDQATLLDILGGKR